MPVAIEDRPSEQVKEEVIDILVHNFSHSIISNEAFERRLDAVIASTTNQQMMDQIADLDSRPTDEVIKHQKEQKFAVNYVTDSDETEEVDTMVNILGGSDRAGQWVVPKEIRVFCLCGGAKLDFTDARFSSPNTKIKVYSLWGGTDIFVSEDINVVSKSVCIMAGIDNKAPSLAGKNAPTITIEGIMLMSGVNVKLKTNLKEKFVAFANQMKTLFSDDKPR
ncbi:DUF1707 and DUF2154 domain-containing protein [Glaciecola sp. MH2013]|uniref:DUF1707 and DUF2154 domain-containing protein n=1 Tax=Glaciecola sp. MH2013 TaxID=2785524 RepID=UPI0018A02B1F|nr:DUF1707 and DUF2154 domain-containing protein [Glaciecola sp. MH2013]MBF7074024.1 DUF1707 and DUF2154 domain-containing protein [Glaciecola sp. MH2013]